jgi:Zn-dependent peptidase ImmA (M78 family)
MGNEDHLPTEAQAIEVYCNRFAGALLVPKKDLLAHDLVRCELAPCEWSDETLALLAKTFKVSQEVILRRLVILNLADSAFYSRKRAEWQASTLVFEQRKLRRRAYPSRRCVRENGVSFVSLVLNAHRQGTITYADIADYLGVRFKYLPEVEELVGGRH